MAPQLIVYRQWEPELCNFFRSILKSGDVFLDVGANFGYYSVLAAHLIGDEGRVFAVEPNPHLCRLLRKNAAINWSIAPIELFENAAFSEPGVMRLHVPKGRAANASLAPQGGDADVHVVEGRRIDDMVPSDINVDVMKVDVEGFELFALKGGEAVIRRSSGLRIVMEWSQAQIRAANTDPQTLLEFCHSCGLTPYRLPVTAPQDEAGWNKLALSDAELLAIPYDNVVLRRPIV